MTTKIDTQTLLQTAQKSEDNEAYQPIAKAGRYRIGIGARQPLPTQPPTFFVEILINLCPVCTTADLGFLERALNLLKILEQKGYTLTCQDGNSILCEKDALEKILQPELEAAKELLEMESKTP